MRLGCPAWFAAESFIITGRGRYDWSLGYRRALRLGLKWGRWEGSHTPPYSSQRWAPVIAPAVAGVLLASGDTMGKYELGVPGRSVAPPKQGKNIMSVGTILLVILIIALLGGFSGIGGGPFYGTGYYGGGGLGIVVVILLVLVLLGRI